MKKESHAGFLKVAALTIAAVFIAMNASAQSRRSAPDVSSFSKAN